VQTTAKCRMLNSPLAISSQHLCAGYADGVTQKGSCYGDSGGPLFSPGQEPKLFGVVSGAIGCGQVDRPTIFMRVSTFMPWIESKAGDLLKK
jgi:urokinase plasminogen activator